MWFDDAKKFYGFLFGSPIISDGTPAWTEEITEVNFAKCEAKSKTNTYELGTEYNIELETLEWPR